MRRPNRQGAMVEAFNEPMTQAELRCKADAGATSVYNFLAALMAAEPRGAHISGWQFAFGTYGPKLAVYSPGPGEDVPFVPSAKTVATRVQEHRARKRAGKPAQEKHITRPSEPVRIPKHHPLTAALFNL